MLAELLAYGRRNHLAALALFISLGGTSYAVAQLPANSVGTRQLKDRAVTAAKIAPSALAHLRGRRGRVGATGPAGPKGNQGPAGAGGPKGDPGAPGTAKAYAHVFANTAVGFRTVVNFASVRREPAVPAGGYCLKLSDPSLLGGASNFNVTAVASADQDDRIAIVNSPGNGCATDELSIHTFNTAGLLTDSGFDVILP
jgi:hypothetical protein